jgi:hypothetical protein
MIGRHRYSLKEHLVVYYTIMWWHSVDETSFFWTLLKDMLEYSSYSTFQWTMYLFTLVSEL